MSELESKTNKVRKGMVINMSNMSFDECVRGRRSVRKYKGDSVPEEVVREVVTIASFAQSWKNTQTTRYIVIENKELKDELAQTCMMDFQLNRDNVSSAPMLIVVTTVTGRSGYERDGSFTTSLGAHWESFDAGIATQTLCMAAYAQGLGTVVLGIFDADKVAKAVKVPQGQKVSALVAVGYPSEKPGMPKRKDVEELLDYRR